MIRDLCRVMASRREFSLVWRVANYGVGMKPKFPSLLLRYRHWVTGLFQAGLIVSALILAWLLRFDFSLPFPPILLPPIPILLLPPLPPLSFFPLPSPWR